MPSLPKQKKYQLARVRAGSVRCFPPRAVLLFVAEPLSEVITSLAICSLVQYVMNDGVAIVMVFKRSISLIIVLMLEMFFKLKNDKL